MFPQRLRAILLDDQRDLISGGRCALQARQQIEAIVLGMTAQRSPDILFEAATDLVIGETGRKQNRQHTRQHEEPEDAAADSTLQGGR